MLIEVTQDHSLFNSNKEKIKPTDINSNTQLEYYTNDLSFNKINLSSAKIIKLSELFNNNKLNRLPVELLNSTNENKKEFINLIDIKSIHKMSKTLLAQINFIKTFK